jgi:hypothetical protein
MKKKWFYLPLLFFVCQIASSQPKGYFSYSVACNSYKNTINNKSFVYCLSPKSITQKKNLTDFYTSYGFIQALLISKGQSELLKNTKNIQDLNLNVSPNPASQFVNISGLPLNDDKLNVRIFSLSGNLLFEKQYDFLNNIATVSLEGFATGVYVMSVDSSNQRKIFKIIKE